MPQIARSDRAPGRVEHVARAIPDGICRALVPCHLCSGAKKTHTAGRGPSLDRATMAGNSPCSACRRRVTRALRLSSSNEPTEAVPASNPRVPSDLRVDYSAGVPPRHALSRVRQHLPANRWACRDGRRGHELARRENLCCAMTRTVMASPTSSTALKMSTYSRCPTLCGARACERAAYRENDRSSDLDCRVDSGGDPARQGLKRVDMALGGGILATRSSRAVAVWRRRCSAAASARLSDRPTWLLGFTSISAAGFTSAKTRFTRTNQIQAFELRTNYIH